MTTTLSGAEEALFVQNRRQQDIRSIPGSAADVLERDADQVKVCSIDASGRCSRACVSEQGKAEWTFSPLQQLISETMSAPDSGWLGTQWDSMEAPQESLENF